MGKNELIVHSLHLHLLPNLFEWNLVGNFIASALSNLIPTISKMFYNTLNVHASTRWSVCPGATSSFEVIEFTSYLQTSTELRVSSHADGPLTNVCTDGKSLIPSLASNIVTTWFPLFVGAFAVLLSMMVVRLVLAMLAPLFGSGA